MKIKYIILPILLLTAALWLYAAKPASGVVQNFRAQDVPYDDGSGVVLSWKPLPREMRIIQYRIYHGVSPDTLFYFGEVEVDPQAGVASDVMYYYDKDYPTMVSIDSPAHLKKEKHQPGNSPLYDRVPRDPNILNRLSSAFTILGVVDQANLYKRSRMVTNADKSVSASLRAEQFEQIAASPKPGGKYYYTVVAVNEKGDFLPYAPIQSAIPVDNPPDNSSRLSAVYLTDTKQFNLEWIPSFNSNDIANWQFWLIPKSLQGAFDAWQQVYMQNGGAPAPWTSQAILLGEKPNDYANYFVINETGDGTKKPLPANMQDYTVVMAAQDYNGYTAYSTAGSFRMLASSAMPHKTIFDVKDKPNDKGDTNTLSFGQPIAFITLATFKNDKRNKIIINYEISDNEDYRIDRIYFDIYSGNGKHLGKIAELYPDKIIKLRLPAGSANVKQLHIKMAFMYKHSNKITDYYVSQDLTFDDTTRRFSSSDIYYKGEDLSHYYYQILRKNKLQSTYTPSKKLATISRNYDDIINYESMLNLLVSGVDKKSGRLLVDPTFVFAVDKKTGMPLSVNIYRKHQEQAVRDMQKELDALKASMKEPGANMDSLATVIEQKSLYLSALLTHPAYKKAQQQKTDAGWLAVLHKEAQHNARSYAYLIMKTDNEGAFTLSDESSYYFPIANWFNMNFLPALIASILFTIIVVITSYRAKRGAELYLRPIAGLQEIDNAVGRATEMGRPILYVPGWSTIGDITTIASMLILNRVAKKAAEYDTRLLVPNSDVYVMPLAQEMVREAFYEAGRPDSYTPTDVYYASDNQFAYAANINGTMLRERSATNFYMGFFNAEALLMTETGNATGSIQIAGTDAITQVPFFITTCDYTLIGEEFYAASAYLSRDIELVSMLKAQDYFKFIIIFFIVLGAVLATSHFNWLTNSFPTE